MKGESSTVRLSPSAQHVRDALDESPALTYAELEERTGYGQSTIRQAFRELRDRGIAVDGHGRPKKFSLPQELRRFPHRAVSLNEEEILALRLAAQVARNVLAPTPMSGPLASAFERLLAEVDDRAVSIDEATYGSQWHFSDAPSAEIRSAVFEKLRSAIQDRHSVEIDYYSARRDTATRNRRVNPWCIAERAGSWLLVAWCRERRAVREFNLVDISRVEPCDPATDPAAFFELEQPFDPDLYFRDRFRALGGDEVYVVRLLVESHQARYFKRKVYHPTQQIEKRRTDGRIVVSYEVEGLDELRSFAQSWGVGVTVLEPEELRRRMRVQAEEILGRYRKESAG